MNVREIKTKISKENQLTTDLSKIIENKRRSLIRLANGELITLFWHIGKELNKHHHKNKRTLRGKLSIATISARLFPNFGSFFLERNLRKMLLFAELFPEFSIVSQFIHFVSWEHILLLLQIPDRDERQFYIKFKIEYGLSVKELKDEISSGLYKKSQGTDLRKQKGKSRAKGIDKNLHSHLQIPKPNFELLAQNDIVMKNVFREPGFSSFRKLLEPSNEVLKKNKKSITIQDQLLTKITEEIEKYRRHQNAWLNTHFNFLFWELGTHINQNILNNYVTNHAKAFIQNTSLVLEKNYGKNFTERQLKASIIFANQFQNPGIVSRIAYLMTWEHILEILPLLEREAVLFYARLVALEGLCVKDLRKQIVKKVYEKSPGAKKLEQDLLYSLKNPDIETKIVKKGNSTEKITTVNYEFNDVDSFIVRNIFNNSFFFDFIRLSK